MTMPIDKHNGTPANADYPVQPRVLILSQRNLYKNVLFRCPHLEFEDIICRVDSADVLAPEPENAFKLRYQFAKRLGWHTPLALNPGLPRIRVQKKYDLFFAICGSPVDLLMLNAIDNWRDIAATSVCLIDEMWIKELPSYRHYLRQLVAKFQIVLLYYSESVRPVSEMIGHQAHYLPPAVDTLLFCPYPQCRERVVDVYSIGRRSDATHQTLLRMVREEGLFYIHDSISGSAAINSVQHRSLLAETAKRSRYFIVNPALIDRRDIRGDQHEIGNRYFEGAASGATMLGEVPESKEFANLFNWPDVLGRVPFGAADVDAYIREWDQQTARQEAMRRNNVSHALMLHDWVYRWEAILKLAGLAPLQSLLQRKERLRELATDVAGSRHSSVSSGGTGCAL